MNNRRTLFVTLLAISLMLVFTSCSTTVALNTVAPAAVNMSGYKTIAVRTTIDDTNFFRTGFRNTNIPFNESVASRYYNDLKVQTWLASEASKNLLDYTTYRIYGALNVGFLNLYDPELTDALVLVGKKTGTVRSTLMEKGIDAILTTSISNLYYDEHIIAEKDQYSQTTDANGNKYYKTKFYVVQKCSVSITYTLTDVESNFVMAYDTVSKNYENRILIGHTKNAAGDFEKDYYTVSTSASIIRSLIDDLASGFRNELTPHYQTEYFELMSNKPKVKSLKDAYELVDLGYYPQALELFLAEYKRSNHIASGYNAAIMYYALGEYDKAYDLSYEVFTRTGSPKAVSLYYRMKDVESRQTEALAQITSKEKASASSTSELVGF